MVPRFIFRELGLGEDLQEDLQERHDLACLNKAVNRGSKLMGLSPVQFHSCCTYGLSGFSKAQLQRIFRRQLKSFPAAIKGRSLVRGCWGWPV
jgi:hypothetical protein